MICFYGVMAFSVHVVLILTLLKSLILGNMNPALLHNFTPADDLAIHGARSSADKALTLFIWAIMTLSSEG